MLPGERSEVEGKSQDNVLRTGCRIFATWLKHDPLLGQVKPNLLELFAKAAL